MRFAARVAPDTHGDAPRTGTAHGGAAVDLAVIRLAASQHRIVTWPQLLEAGLSRRAVAHRVATGRLYRRHQGVYLLEPPDAAQRITLLAAALAACRPDAFLCGYAAAEHWGLTAPMVGDIDVTVVGRNPGTRRTGIRIHRVRFIDPRDIRIHRGLQVAVPARVALELAAQLAGARLEELLARARVEHSIADREYEAVLGRYPRYPGARTLRGALATRGGPSLTRSDAERRLLDLIRQADLPRPSTNLRVGRYEVDFVWVGEGLAVEVDGYKFHQDRSAFERDRRRDAALLADGWRVMRFTWRQIVEEPFTVVARIAQVLGNTAN